MQVQKKTTASILLIIFVLNGAGLFKVYRTVSQRNPKRATQGQSRRENLLSIVLNEGESTLQEKGYIRLEEGEYEYEGHRYDVVSHMKNAGKVTVMLKHDSVEEELLSFLRSFFNTSSQRHKTSLKFNRNIVKRYLPSRENLCGQTLHSVPWIAPPNHIFYPNPYRETQVPPPKAA